jgi:hypothetical protein
MKKIIIIFMIIIIACMCSNNCYKEDMDLVTAKVINRTPYNIEIQYKDLICIVNNNDLNNQYNVGDKISACVVHKVGKKDKIINSQLIYK